MEVTSTTLRRGLALGIGSIGILVAWLTLEPSGLLVAVAAVCIWLGWEAGLTAIAAGGIFWTVMLLSRGAISADDSVRTAVFLGAAAGIWLLVQVFRSVSLSDVLGQDSRRLVADIPGLGWTADAHGRLRFINPAVLAFIGITPAEMRKLMETEANPLERWAHPDDLERTRINWGRALRAGEPLIDEQRILRYDGEYRWFRDTVVPTRDRRGRITGWYGHTADITDQKKAEEALRRSERELRLLIDTVPAHIWMLTPDGQPSYYNKQLVEWMGMDVGGAGTTGTNTLPSIIEAAVHPDDSAEAETALRRSLLAGAPHLGRYRIRRYDGSYRWVQARAEPLRDENGEILHWYGVNIDINEEVRAQEALRLADDRLARASRAASLSELSVSIAHELNSPLQAVVSNANAFQRWLAADPPNYERAERTAERIIRDANAAAEVISRIRALFGQSAQGRAPVDLNAVIIEVSELLGDKLQTGNVRLDLGLDPALPPVSADRVQMEQVVLNLVRNAIEAMQDVSAASRIVRIVSRRRGDDALEVEVEDRGHGISDPDRIFDAFYTTKQDGLGMGLAICRSIVEAHGGRINARSAPGEGSSVGFTLPVRATSAVASGS